MAISNTSILIKRSTTTGTPSSLKAGELAYSYLSNTIFIGNSTGTGVVNVGGQYYTSQIDNATSANGSGTIVKRDVSGNIAVNYITANGGSFGNLTANTANLATYATQLQNPQYFGAYGDASAANVSFNGTANVELGITLATVNSNVGAYGNTTSIPTITVDAKGRITAISNNTIATSFTVSGNTGSGSQQGGGTLTIEGNGTGITTAVTGSGGSETVLIGTDNTILRSNTSGVGPQTIGTDVSISGNLIVSGTATYVNTSIVQTNDSMIELAANNTTGDVIDIGFYGLYNNGSTNNITGLLRDAGSKNYYLFANIAATNASIANTLSNNYFTQSNTATLYTNVNGFQGTFGTANITNATVGTLSLTNALAVGQGGTGQTTFAAGQILIGNGSGALQVLANTGTAGTYGNSAYHPVITTDAYGRVSSVTNTAIAIAASQVTSGTLALAQGGTNNSSYVNNQITYFNGSSIVSLANTGTAGTYGNAAYIPVVTTDGFGRVSGVSNTAIAIPASQLTNGTTGSGSVVLAASPTLTGTTTAATLNVTQLNVTTLNVTYSNVNSVTANNINIGSLTYAATGAFVAFGSNANNYQQVVIQNANTGTQASADFVVSNFNSTDTTLYGDFGINGPNFVGTGALNVANNVYLYAQSTDLAIGTNSANAIHFVVNNGVTDAMTIASNGYVSIAQALATVYGGTGQSSFTQNGMIYGNGTGALQVTAAAGGADQTWSNQILTVNNTGVPTWTTTMDGGGF